MKNLKEIGKKFGEWALVAALFGGVLYAAATSWQNHSRLEAISADVREIKRSMVRMLLDEKPDKSLIINGLVSDAGFSQGVKEFKSGNYTAAYKAWEESASAGDRNAVHAIEISANLLKEKIQSASLSYEQRRNVKNALEYAATIDIKEQDGFSYQSLLAMIKSMGRTESK